VTATRDRQSDLDEPPPDLAWDQRPIFGNARGLPWWAAVLLAFGVAAIAAAIDIQRQNSLGRIYQGAYVLGCILAVAAVRRRNLFGPIVQPPLVFAVTAIGAIVLAQPGSPFSAGLKQLVFTVALPLTSNFLTMAFTTAITVAIGLFRLFRQRNPDPRVRSNRRQRTRDQLDERSPRAMTELEPDRPARDRRRPDRAGGRGDQDLSQPPPRVGGRDRRERQARAERAEQPPPRSGRGRAEPPPPARGGRERSMPPENRRRQPGDPGQRRPDQDPPRRSRRRDV
jgi:hypothetical protein